MFCQLIYPVCIHTYVCIMGFLFWVFCFVLFLINLLQYFICLQYIQVIFPGSVKCGIQQEVLLSGFYFPPINCVMRKKHWTDLLSTYTKSLKVIHGLCLL